MNMKESLDFVNTYSLVSQLYVVLADVSTLVNAKSPVIKDYGCDVWYRVEEKLKHAKRWLEQHKE